MKEPNPTKILICSDVDYDHLIAEIYLGDKFVALISQEAGKDKLQIEFPRIGLNQAAVCEKLELDYFLSAVEEAKRKLIGT